jgi:hypothetical protein
VRQRLPTAIHLEFPSPRVGDKLCVWILWPIGSRGRVAGRCHSTGPLGNTIDRQDQLAAHTALANPSDMFRYSRDCSDECHWVTSQVAPTDLRRRRCRVRDFNLNRIVVTVQIMSCRLEVTVENDLSPSPGQTILNLLRCHFSGHCKMVLASYGDLFIWIQLHATSWANCDLTGNNSYPEIISVDDSDIEGRSFIDNIRPECRNDEVPISVRP